MWNCTMWVTTKHQKFGVAIYNFHCEEIGQTLRLDIGDTVQIHEECEGWYRGISTKNRSVRGIFPSSYIHLKPFKIDSEGSSEVVVPAEDSVIQEATCVLREWGQIWKKLYVGLRVGEGEVVLWETIRDTMLKVCDWRKILINSTLTSDQISQLKIKITRKIDWGNRKLGLDLVPRTNGEMVDPSSVCVVDLYQVHVFSAETSQHHCLGLSTMAKKKIKPKVDSYHLFFCMRDFSCQIGENMELYFSLFDANTNNFNFISERFFVKQPKEGFNNYVDRVNSNCTIFTDLGTRDLSCDIYIVAHIVRVGKMLFENMKRGSVQNYRRPYGIAVFKPSVEMLKRDDKEIELVGKVQTTDEKDMWQLLDLILKKQTNKFSLTSSNSSLVISVKLLQGDLDQAIKENPLLLKDICITRKLGFSDVIMPGEVRNDLYVTLSHGEFERGGKSVGKNIEVTVIACDITGHQIQCIYSGTGHKGTPEFSSTIMYHNNSPHWKEQIKLALPIDTFSKAHLRFEYRHCSTREKNEKKLFGFSFIRLMEDEGGTTLRNGAHELCVYKCDDRSRLIVPAEYMSCPFLSKNAVDCVYSLPFQRSPREYIVVETLLCSTKLTQNVDLLSLLRWKSAPDGIGETLSRLVRVDGAETVKFLQDVLDALFSMFSTEDGNSTQYSGHVFHALVFIFCLLEDGKFKHFKPVMDAYISGHFAAALVYKGLISCVKHLSDLCPQTDKQDPILNCFCSLEYIFKFIIQSRILFAKATGGQNEETFRIDIDELFESFVQLLGVGSDHILYTQVALLEHVQGACDQMYRTLTTVAVVHHLNSLLYAINIDAPNPIVQAKLHAIKNAISLTIFEEEESRGVFLRMATDHLRHHFITKQEIALCADVLSNIIIFTYKEVNDYSDTQLSKSMDQDIKTIVLKIVDVIIEVILSLDVSTCCFEENGPVSELSQLLEAMKKVSVPSRASVFYGSLFFPVPILENQKKDNRGSLIASLMAIWQMMRSYHFPWFWEAKIKEGTKTQLRTVIDSILKLFDQLVKFPVFPSDWFVMRMVANQTILTVMTEIAKPLVTYFLLDGPFDSQLWSTYFNLAVGFLTQPSLQLEHFSQQKRHNVLERYGDMRVQMGFQILSLWHNLDHQRLFFIPGMVGPFLEVTLVPEAELRKATLPIFFDMMQAEQQEKGNFKQVETELIDKLDILVSENKGDDEYRQVFNTILLERVKLEDPSWSETGAAFIQSVTRLLERLLDYRSVMQGDENSDKRMSCTVNLLNFYKNEINRQEMYVRYIYKLADLHLPAGNYTEAAFTLNLHAKQLSWSQRVLHADHLYQAQTEFQRKEMIYLRIIDYFDRGKCWEEGIPLLRELAEKYRLQVFDYKKLSDVHRQLATFYENILKGERYKHEYFRVGFYGHGLPLFVRNKVFIYRGLEYESIPAFTQRLQTEFPHAKLLSHNTPPDDVTKSADEQFIQICAVKPIAEPRSEFEGIEVDERILKYYANNQVKKFVLDRPTHRGPIDKDNEFKNLWIERIIYTTECDLPGILKWFEVVEQVTEQVCPPQYACETVLTNIQQIRHMTTHYKGHPKENIQPFTMRLQGSIDAAVNGGIAKYQDAFFTHEYSALHPQFSDYVVNLKALMVEQTQVLERALDLHGRIAPSVNQPLHKRLLEVFEGLRLKVQRLCSTPQSQRSTTSLQSMALHTPTHRRADSDPSVEFRRVGSIINSPLPPVPCDRKENIPHSSSTSGHSSQRSSQSSSLYAHFTSVSHDEDLYAKPLEEDDISSNIRDSRPRLSYDSRGSSPRSFSVSSGTEYALAPSPKPLDEKRRTRHHSRPSSPRSLREALNSSWSDSHSQSSYEAVPPIPPKGTDRASRSISLSGSEDQPPPIYPKKINKKMSSFHSDDGNLISNGFTPSTPNSPPPPAISPRNQRSPPPPPIPPKSSLSNPLTPLTPTSSSDFASLRGSQEEIQNPRYSAGTPSDNYSVPLKLKQFPPPHSPPP